MHSLGAAIRWARQAPQVSLRALAEKLDVSAPYISDVEHDRRTMKRALVEKVADVLDVDRIDLLSRARQSSRSLREFIEGHPNLRLEIAQLMERCDCEWCLQWDVDNGLYSKKATT